jgi:diguanylate cyclase (GGDEF)-like protein
MGNPEKLSSILDLCIDIDKTAIEIYNSLSDYAENEALRGFWGKMVTEGQSHLEYWQRLKTLPEFDELPDAFNDPDSVIHELEKRSSQIQALQQQWEKDKTVNSAFVIAYRLESYKLHPAMRTLFQYFRPITDGTVPEERKELDETNISAFVEALRKYGKVTPELELIGETLQRLWDQNKALSEQSMVDPLSGLHNRRGFFTMAEQMAHLSKRGRTPVSVMLLEIDNFKAINDLHGTQKGDDILKEIARMLQSTLRQSDLIARYGGDEYILLLPNTAKEGGMSVAEKLRGLISKARPAGVPLTVSVGGAEDTMKDNAEQELQNLIRYAEGNLIVAKTNGKNQVVF